MALSLLHSDVGCGSAGMSQHSCVQGVNIFKGNPSIVAGLVVTWEDP